MKQKRWIWLVFLILLVALLAVLGTRYNFTLTHTQRSTIEQVFGTLGFLVAMAGMIIFFARLVQEMRLSQLQSEFLAAVTHELKTPISTLELASSLLMSGDLTREESDKLWKSHAQELKRLRTEVEALLEAARWDAHAVHTKRSPVDLESWLAEALPKWQNSLGADARFERLGETLRGSARIDPRILSLITDNLIDNSRKFAQGAPQVTVTTRILPRSGLHRRPRWEMEFRDAGWGFPTEESKKIFRRFYRSRHGAPYSIAGTGLGLYLASQAAKRMRLLVSATSPGLGHGATFTVQGPLDE